MAEILPRRIHQTFTNRAAPVGCSFHTQARGCASDKRSLIFSGNPVAGAVRCSVGKDGPGNPDRDGVTIPKG